MAVHVVNSKYVYQDAEEPQKTTFIFISPREGTGARNETGDRQTFKEINTDLWRRHSIQLVEIENTVASANVMIMYLSMQNTNA